MSQSPQWFAIRQALSNKQATTLTVLSFLLPILLWSLVSYVPFLWHPKVEIADPGSVSWFPTPEASGRPDFAACLGGRRGERRSNVLDTPSDLVERPDWTPGSGAVNR